MHSLHQGHRRAEIAVNIAKELWGCGYGTEAIRAVISAGFSRYDFNRIEGNCMVQNVAAARVLEKAGMKFEGILREYLYAKGAFHNVKLYSILRSD